jgi:DNA ligase-1
MQPILLKDYVGQPVSGWLMSEKLDGWRMMWDGKNFYSRELGLLDAPEWFKAGMPDTPLDGELFAGRGMFNRIQGMMRDGWRGLTFQVFDAPALKGGFSSRHAMLTAVADTLPDHVAVVAMRKVKTTREVVEAADEIVKAGGEGVVVRNPKGKYVSGRSNDVLRWVPRCPRLNRL